MRRVIFCVLIYIVCFFSSGCIVDTLPPHPLTHPLSEITAPTFCIYDGHMTDQESKPLPIYYIKVRRLTKFTDERLDWAKWKEYADIYPFTDQVAWEIEYDPDGKSTPPSKPFACITYSEVPPGYIETIPAQPLIPERFYAVRLRSNKVGLPGLVFIIRVDAQGHPTQLEHRSEAGDWTVYVINRE